MKIALSILLFLVGNFIQAQYCVQNNRFTEAVYFTPDKIDSLKNVEYAVALDYKNKQTSLKCDAYFPKLSSDNLKYKPLVVMIHGGGFQTGSRTDRRTECIALAQRGFVAVTISYRLGHTNEQEQLQAIYRAQQDANAAFRYLIANYKTYGIDTNTVFVGGSSAGAITANNVHYVDQDEWNGIYPGIETLLGPINTSGNIHRNSFAIKGIFNNWGAIIVGTMQANEMVPQIAFHGELDPTVEIDTNGTLMGSRSIHYALEDNGICTDITIDPNGQHGIYTNYSGAIFRSAKTSCFFRSVLCSSCSNQYATTQVQPSCSKTLGTEAVNTVNAIEFFPNPMNEFLQISGVPNNTYITIYDAVGTLVLFSSYSDKIAISSLKNGLYVVQIRDNNNEIIVQRKVIKA